MTRLRRGQAPGRRSAALAPVVLLAACAAVPPAVPAPPYVGPSVGPVARLVVRGTVADGESYRVHVFDDGERCSGPRLLGAGSKGRHPASATLAAGRLETLEFHLLKPAAQRVCVVRLSFEPQAGRTYLFAGSAATGGCSASVLDATDPDDMRPERSAMARGSASQHCLPIAEARAAGSLAPSAAPRDGDARLGRGVRAEDLKGLIEP